MVIPSIVDVSPSPFPWFIYSNLLQNVSRSFINSATLCEVAISWLFHAQTYALATHPKSCLKFDVPRSRLSWAETVHKTPVLKTLSSTN